jgi:hypothetical protein
MMIDVTVWVPARSAIVAVRIDAVLRNRPMPHTSDPDPHAWLRPYYGRLQSIHAFNLLSPAHQFEQLRQAVAPEHPVEAEQMREWSPAAQTALMVNLAKVVPTASVTVTYSGAFAKVRARSGVSRNTCQTVSICACWKARVFVRRSCVILQRPPTSLPSSGGSSFSKEDGIRTVESRLSSSATSAAIGVLLPLAALVVILNAPLASRYLSLPSSSS